MDNIWTKALALLQSEVNEQIFSAWFSGISFVSSDDSSITLGVANKFSENWIKEKYISLLKTSIQQVAGKSLSVLFKVVAAPNEPFLPLIDESKKEEVPSLKKESLNEKDRPVGWLRSVFSSSKNIPENKPPHIGLNKNYTFANFVVGQSNRFAHAASLAVSEKLSRAYNPLFLYGGVGLGKTHLMQAMGHEVLKNYPRAKVLYMSSEEFTNQLIHAIRTKTTSQFRDRYRHVDILLIDDIQFIAGKDSTQEEFFHTFNALHDAHKQIVLCSDRSPLQIKALEERLVSRFAWGLIADIQSPDFETRMAIMEKKSENEEINVPKETLYFLAENIKTNIREMEGALIRVAAYSKLTGKEMTPSLAKEVLRGMITAEEKKITMEQIQKIVASYYGIKETDMKTKKRTRSIAYPRQVAMFLSRELTDHSLPDIGSSFGGRDHTTVLHACEKISSELKEKEETQTTVVKLRSLIQK
ncbi:MAG: chromosomal replication initiator protein DnaA [Candidatus Omnitrophota bacterium]